MSKLASGKKTRITKKYVFKPEIIDIAVAHFKDNISSSNRDQCL